MKPRDIAGVIEIEYPVGQLFRGQFIGAGPLKDLPELNVCNVVDVYLQIFGFHNHHGNAAFVLDYARLSIRLPVQARGLVHCQWRRLAHPGKRLIAPANGKIKGVRFTYRVNLVLSQQAGPGAYLECKPRDKSAAPNNSDKNHALFGYATQGKKPALRREDAGTGGTMLNGVIIE
jgi:hypothetical protein